MKFWDRSLEFKALIISSIATIVCFCATLFLFWYGYPEIPLAVVTSGLIVVITWLVAFLYLKKNKEPKIKIDVILIYVRLFLIVGLAVLFAVLEIAAKIVILSPVFIVVGYLVVSLLTLLAFIRKDKNV